MPPKHERLDRAAFTRAWKRGHRARTPTLLLVYAPGATRQLGVVVSKKVARRATARNMIRRRLYAALNAAYGSTGTLIAVAQPAAAASSYETLLGDMRSGLERLV